MRLSYASEADDAMGRLWRKQRKLEAKLGEDYQKPKGMRPRTYEHICAQIDEVEVRKDAAFCLGACHSWDAPVWHWMICDEKATPRRWEQSRS
jgi:hypothetical protein